MFRRILGRKREMLLVHLLLSDHNLVRSLLSMNINICNDDFSCNQLKREKERDFKRWHIMQIHSDLILIRVAEKEIIIRMMEIMFMITFGGHMISIRMEFRSIDLCWLTLVEKWEWSTIKKERERERENCGWSSLIQHQESVRTCRAFQ